MQIKISFEGAGALEKATVKKEEGNKVLIFKDNFPFVEYDAEKLQYPNVIGSDFTSSDDEFIDATKRDENIIKYLEQILRDAREEAKHRLELRELEREKRRKEELKKRENSLLGMIPIKEDFDLGG